MSGRESRPSRQLSGGDLPFPPQAGLPRGSVTAEEICARPPSFREATRQFQRELLTRELDDADWNVSAVARRLQLARSHLYNLIKVFELRR